MYFSTPGGFFLLSWTFYCPQHTQKNLSDFRAICGKHDEHVTSNWTESFPRSPRDYLSTKRTDPDPIGKLHRALNRLPMRRREFF